ncbi:unnamed protein product [Adineta steineri]|uniref:GH16 domain-containing protein n=1 Tax=Adineta steineri TaxID=433720 RepID=A0A813VPP6_9BILA|nr:unnamed protein product [Adineta steineri]CAF4037642.1 unnamed protein product [Adineta steineri]
MGVQQGESNTNPLPRDGGFELGQGNTEAISVPDEWDSGRLWARTGCKDENGKFQCKTGNCGAEKNEFKMQCKGIGGERPATVAEFTLHNAQHDQGDTYDMSNVDGHNIGMSIKPIEGTYESVDNPELNEYNCGTMTCKFDMSQCPPELTMDDGNGGKVCLSICAAIHNAQQREQHEHLKKIFDDEEKRSLVCCSEDKGYNHSPYNKEDREQGKKLCEVEKWPRSSDNKRYDEIFKEQCPDAYSWQFDDLKSTYQCKNAHYEITLCPGGDVLHAENNITTSGIKHTTRKLIDYLTKSASLTSQAPSVTTEAPIDEPTTQDQCHAYCMANLDFYQKQKPTPVDVTTEQSSAAPTTNTTDKVLHADTEWKRVFEDEFNEDGAVDNNKWKFETGTADNGWGNNELQYYTDRSENAHCENGYLSIEAKKEDFQGSSYTSARLNSKQSFTYGRLQIRAKVPAGKGTWSALWMLPDEKIYGSKYWPDNGEIDLMEQVGYDPSKVHSSVHTKANNGRDGNNPSHSIDINDATTEYKVYTLQWDSDKIEMFVSNDETNAFDKSIFKWEKGDKDWTQWPFDKPFHILMNVAIGGDWGGKQGIDENAFPQRMEIDWVRFYEKQQNVVEQE